MIFALLPVKAPQHAKQRLGGLLNAAEREALARTMYEEVLDALCAARGFDRIVVVTSDASAAGHARRAGAEVFEERRQLSHSHSADAAARRAMEMGADTVALLPIDVPLVTAREIEDLLASHQSLAPRDASSGGRKLTIVPSADGTGTNALVRTPPDVIESRFGPGSLALHLGQARAGGIAAQVLRPAGLVFDIDTPEDLAELIGRNSNCRAAQLVRSRRAVE